MKIDAKLLAAATQRGVKIATRRTTLPILTNFRLSAKDGFLTVVATDLDSRLETLIPCDGDLEPTCCSANTLNDLAQNAADQITVTRDGDTLKVSAKWKSTLSTAPAAEFPLFDEKLTHQGIQSADLAEGINAVLWAVDTAKEITVMNGVRIESTPKLLNVVGCNRKQMAYWSRPLICVRLNCIVPIEFADSLATELQQPEASLVYSKKWIGATHADGGFYCKQLDGVYPNWNALLTEEKQEPMVSIPRDEMIQACRMCLALNPDKTEGIWADLEFGKQLRISIRTKTTAFETVIATQAKRAFTARFNVKYLLAALQAVAVDAIDWHQEDNRSPATFRSTDLLAMLACQIPPS